MQGAATRAARHAAPVPPRTAASGAQLGEAPRELPQPSSGAVTVFMSRCCRAFIYIFIYICVYVYIFIYICVYIVICLYIYFYIYIFVCVYIYLYIFVYVYFYISFYIFFFSTLLVSFTAPTQPIISTSSVYLSQQGKTVQQLLLLQRLSVLFMPRAL